MKTENVSLYRVISRFVPSNKHAATALPHKVKTQYLHFRSHAEYFLLSWKIPQEISRRSMLFHNLRGVSTVPNICTYNLCVWKWIKEKFDIKWMKNLATFSFLKLLRQDLVNRSIAEKRRPFSHVFCLERSTNLMITSLHECFSYNQQKLKNKYQLQQYL